MNNIDEKASKWKSLFSLMFLIIVLTGITAAFAYSAHEDKGKLIGFVGMFGMSSFMMLTAYSFFTFKLPNKREQFDSMMKKLEFDKDNGPAYLPKVDQEYQFSDYFAPVLFTTSITLIGSAVIFFGSHMIGSVINGTDEFRKVNLILEGPNIVYYPDLSKKTDGLVNNQPKPPPNGEAVNNQPGPATLNSNTENNQSSSSTPDNKTIGKQSKTSTNIKYVNKTGPKLFGMLVIALAFSGSYVWTIQNLFRRFATLDLPPGAYYSAGVRMLFSIFVALLIYYFFFDSLFPATNNEQPSIAMTKFVLILSFLIGMFPQQGIKFIQEKINVFYERSGEESDPLPLSMIEGIQVFERVRFSEVGIENAQNLAKANFIELVIRTPFNPRELIDWIGQARLYLFFKSDISKLRSAGIRTVFDFKTIGKGDHKDLVQLSKQTGLPLERLELVNKIIEDDFDTERYEYVIKKLIGADHGQNRKLAKPLHPHMK